MHIHNPFADEQWWLSMNLYQIFVRSFNDSNGDGVGDIPGITAQMEYIKRLGVTAIWLTPFYTSPQADMGYDVANYRDVDPRFGTLADFDAMVAKAHSLELKVIIDIVPNHTSSEHPWFKEALASAPGSAARNRYLFADGRDGGAKAPNDWEGWTTESPWAKVDTQYYLHLFSEQQPDLNWKNEEVREEFRNTLRFWLKRGVDGIRVDAPTTLIKPDLDAKELENNLPETFTIYANWKEIISKEFGPRCVIGEVFDTAKEGMEMYIDKAHMDQIFCFEYQSAAWTAAAYREVVESWVETTKEHGSTSVWVSSTHDLVRMATYLGLEAPDGKPSSIGPDDTQPDYALGQKRVRALTLMTMCLPGAIVTYYGEELGLPDHTKLTSADLGGRENDRDGCRIPMPWKSSAKNLGFTTAKKPWLPQPAVYKKLSVNLQETAEGSMLNLYKTLFRLREEHTLWSNDSFAVLEHESEDVLMIRTGNVCVVVNFGEDEIDMPPGEIIAKSLDDIDTTTLPGQCSVWLYQDWDI